MSFRLKHINWKYIVGEILLLFVGINLAIWFNDWNSAKSIQKDKEIALTKIKGEIEANLVQLVENRTENQKIPPFVHELDGALNEQDQLLLSPTDWENFRAKYPNFIVAIDSVFIGDGIYNYISDTSLYLEITDLSSIAWEISKSTGIFHEFGYDCLYDLQGMYYTQDLVRDEMKKATDALSNRSIDDLVKVLKIINQLEVQLEGQYRDMIENIDNCK
ncbi:hypothetical protein M3P19_06605 [Muricauda sp. 2012CJ35-5]|uniref:Uncharacterized protein n=1 Tax=Flagellimonas spongiicola TaxID=2942208 RepID=A0ABT0PQJ9_9FLAO|nr:hypothetical protein [Allomuricauda spongiicola]MCL6273672.1 hypothetical protein [Allomuricauda spongiicola]